MLIYISSLYAQKSYIIINEDNITIGAKLSHPQGSIGNLKYHYIVQEFEKGRRVMHSADSVSEFGVDRQIFISVPSPMGEDGRVFFQQIVKNDDIAVYLYENETGRHFYFKEGAGDYKEITEENNLYVDYINNIYSSDKDHPINRYTIELTPKSIKFADKLARTGNPNFLTRFRYGLWVGGGISMFPESVMFDRANDNHLFAGVFLNAPLFGQVSIQTELFYMHEAYSISSENDSKAYNRKSIVLPVMPRYSLTGIKGRVIPYIQVGPAIHFALNEKIEEQSITITDENVYINDRNVFQEKNHFFVSVNTGIGLEYKLNNKRSLFGDIRYAYTQGKETNNLFYITISVNL